MNMSELAARMLEWEDTQRKADALRSEIEAAVMDLGKTQTVGNVRATYSAGRKSYDYRGAIDAAGQNGFITTEALDPYTTVVPASVSIDFRAACQGLGIEDVPYTQSEPSVSVKLVG